MNSMYPKKSTPRDAGPASPEAPAAATKAGTRRYQVRPSGIHGKGVFAVRPMKKGEMIVEYKGQIISWKEALRRHPHDPSNPDHTFYFHIDDKHVIDGNVDGNSSKWINHGCRPNCEAEQDGDRVFIRALRAIEPDEELSFDYGLILEGRHTAKVKKQFECRCGARGCRGTMLAPKR
jgi:SET domain-containing protein